MQEPSACLAEGTSLSVPGLTSESKQGVVSAPDLASWSSKAEGSQITNVPSKRELQLLNGHLNRGWRKENLLASSDKLLTVVNVSERQLLRTKYI